MSHELTLPDRARLRLAALRYDLWLDMAMVRGRDRRELRRELHTNLVEAAHQVGVRRALDGVGDLRTMARAVTHDGALRSRWVLGGYAALVAGMLSVLAFVFASLAFADGVLFTQVTTSVQGQVFPFFGSEVTVMPPGTSSSPLSMSMSPGLVPLVAAAAAGLIAARPWIAILDRRPGREPVAS